MPERETQVEPSLSGSEPSGGVRDRDTGVVPGTQGYADQAPRLIDKYDAYSFEQLWGPALPHLPPPGATVLDIGAGSGRDARWFADRGDRVLAVEPTAPLRDHGTRTSPGVEWLDAHLPALQGVPEGPYDVVVLDAVWMHFEARERLQGAPEVARRVGSGGVLLISLRHGPVPEGRRMFPVSVAETTELFASEGLELVVEAAMESLGPRNRAAGVTWSYLVYGRNA